MHPFPVRNRITLDTRSFHLSVRILVSITEPFSFEIIEIEINPLRLIIFPQRIESNSIKISLFLILVKILPFLMEFYNIYIYICFTLEHNSKLSILRLLHHFPSLIRALPLSLLVSLSPISRFSRIRWELVNVMESRSCGGVLQAAAASFRRFPSIMERAK